MVTLLKEQPALNFHGLATNSQKRIVMDIKLELLATNSVQLCLCCVGRDRLLAAKLEKIEICECIQFKSVLELRNG